MRSTAFLSAKFAFHTQLSHITEVSKEKDTTCPK